MPRVDARKVASGQIQAASLDPWALNKLLSRTSTSDEIATIVGGHGGAMNSVNCATALHRLARGGATERGELERTLCGLTANILEREAGRVTARSLTSIAWAVGKLRLSDAGLLAALTSRAAAQLEARALDAFGIANVAWALATLYMAATSATTETVNHDHGGLFSALATEACARASEFKPQEMTNLVWAFATLKWRHGRLFEQLAESATPRLAEFTPQGLSQTVWAYSKLGLGKHALLIAAANAALPRLHTYDAQSLATLAWGFANLEVEHRGLLAGICREASQRPTAFDASSCPQLLWAFSRLREGLDASSVAAMASRLGQVAAAGLSSQQLVYALGALAKLPTDADGGGGGGGGGCDAAAASLPARLCAAAAAAAPSLTANKLGIAAWALARPSVSAQMPSAVSAAWLKALRARATQVVEHLGWRSIGHVEVALRAAAGPAAAAAAAAMAELDEADELVQVLTLAAELSFAQARERSLRRNALPAELMRRKAPWAGRVLKGSRILLAGFDPEPELDAALTKAGLLVTHWRRFACSAVDAACAAWPPAPPPAEGGSGSGGYDACLVRWPWYAAGEAAAMALHAVAACTAPSASLWLCGNLDEGAEGAAAAIGAAFGEAHVLDTSDEGAILYRAKRAAASVLAPAATSTLEGWCTRGRITWPPSAMPHRRASTSASTSSSAAAAEAATAAASAPWQTYPGLFAGGGLDVMTTALLAALPPPPEGASVLDFCCGSGAIAAALAAAPGGGSLRLHLLDADAVAIAAARANVPSASRLFLSAGWPDTPTAFAKKGKPPKCALTPKQQSNRQPASLALRVPVTTPYECP